jgi:hypothetical protein
LIGRGFVGWYEVVVNQELTFDVYPVEFRRKDALEGPENVVEFARRRLEFEPDELQAQVLLSDSKRGF